VRRCALSCGRAAVYVRGAGVRRATITICACSAGGQCWIKREQTKRRSNGQMENSVPAGTVTNFFAGAFEDDMLPRVLPRWAVTQSAAVITILCRPQQFGKIHNTGGSSMAYTNGVNSYRGGNW